MGDTTREAILKLISEKADLTGADFTDVNLRGADLRGAKLTDADLTGANLMGADLTGADLTDADLRGADLRGASLRYANLRGASLRYANLMGADLTVADLRGADLDFSSVPLRCSSLNIITDDKIKIQHLYHLLRQKGDIVDPDLKELLLSDLAKKVANKFHRVNECGVIK